MALQNGNDLPADQRVIQRHGGRSRGFSAEKVIEQRQRNMSPAGTPITWIRPLPYFNTFNSKASTVPQTVDRNIVTYSENRCYLLIQNIGTVDLLLGFGHTVAPAQTALEGDALLLPAGSGNGFDWTGESVPNNDIYAVGVGGVGAVLVTQGIRSVL